MAGTRYEVMKRALDILLAAAEFDAVVAVPGSSARFDPNAAVQPVIDCAGGTTPLVAFVMPEAPDALRMLREAGVAAFRTPEACADAVVTTFGRVRPRSTPARVPLVAGDVLDEAESYGVLQRLGVPVADHAVLLVADLPLELPVAAPAAVKVLDRDLPHKSDVGGVVLDVHGGAGLRTAVNRIRRDVTEASGLAVGSVIVQSMARGLAEVLIGYRVDESGAPVVVLAAGGVTAEIYGDRAIRPAPVDLATAGEMIDEIVALRVLGGFRNQERGDLDALAKAVVAISRAGELSEPHVLEVEANPVLVQPLGRGVVAVDALVRTGLPVGSA
jgi:acyl-CoA synthetase (NDP forming)